MPLDDSDPEKWKYKEHTEVKHQILRKYLTAWTRILLYRYNKLHYFDCFAGKAMYDGERGSPLLALDVAEDNSEKVGEFHLTFNDLNDENYSEMVKAVNEERRGGSQNVFVEFENQKFEDIAPEIIKSNKFKNIPSLVFVDPFGYGTAPFESVSEIMEFGGGPNEVFITFMVGKIRRFISDPDKEDAITRALGTNDWTHIRELNESENIEEEILKLYTSKLKDNSEINYVFPFQMMHPDRRLTAYYLIHATKNFKGLKVMKDIMFGSGSEDNFAYLGRDHYGFGDNQQSLTESTGAKDARIDELEDYLMSLFSGEQLMLWDIMKHTYSETDLIQKHYREAVLNLEMRGEVQVINFPERDNGTTDGLQSGDEILFSPKNTKLTKWT